MTDRLRALRTPVTRLAGLTVGVVVGVLLLWRLNLHPLSDQDPVYTLALAGGVLAVALGRTNR